MMHAQLFIPLFKFILQYNNSACYLKYSNSSHNLVYNILIIYNTLVRVRFTTSKTKLNIQYSKLGVQVASRVAERLKTYDLRELENIRKISKLGGRIGQCSASLQEIRLCQQQLKNTRKQIPNFFFLSSLTKIPYFVSNILFEIVQPKTFLVLPRLSLLPTPTFSSFLYFHNISPFLNKYINQSNCAKVLNLMVYVSTICMFDQVKNFTLKYFQLCLLVVS